MNVSLINKGRFENRYTLLLLEKAFANGIFVTVGL